MSQFQASVVRFSDGRCAQVLKFCAMVEGPPKRGAPAPLLTITLVTRLAHQNALVKCVGLFASGHHPVEVMLDTPIHGSSRRAAEMARWVPPSRHPHPLHHVPVAFSAQKHGIRSERGLRRTVGAEALLTFLWGDGGSGIGRRLHRRDHDRNAGRSAQNVRTAPSLATASAWRCTCGIAIAIPPPPLRS